MAPKLVVAAATGLLVAALALPTTAFADRPDGPGASDCQPEAGQQTVFLAHLPGPLGELASFVATSGPGATRTLTLAALFACPPTPEP
jgi:hypothetical protein